MTYAAHENSGKNIMQLAHAGLLADPELTGKTPLANGVQPTST
jgi:2,4-dienoyl-CoA reductase-like NADH-dependent reductase (Old Yellow Enzyme family)